MSYRHCWALFAVLTFAALILVGSGAGGCDQTIDLYSCPDPIVDRLDYRGQPDPCCRREPYCCDQPVPDFNDVTGQLDPCCLTTPCPNLRKLLWPDAGEASDASSADDADADAGGGS
jgi:hypothetical protein